MHTQYVCKGETPQHFFTSISMVLINVLESGSRKPEPAQSGVNSGKQTSLRNYNMHIQSSLSFISPSHAPPKLYTWSVFLTCCIFFFSSWPQMVEMFTLLLSAQVRGKHLSLSCRPLASPKSSMGRRKSFLLHMLVRSPFCSSLQGCSELPG